MQLSCLICLCLVTLVSRVAKHSLMFRCLCYYQELDSTKVQTLGAISESIMRQDTSHNTVPQLAILFDGPPAHAVYQSVGRRSM